MTAALCDASIVIKWFVTDEPEVPEARAILAAHERGAVNALILDLTVYEVGNVLVKGGLEGSRVARDLMNLEILIPEALALTPRARARTSHLAAEHSLTFYDAAYWAVAESMRIPLVSADTALIAAGGALSPTEFCARHNLTVER